MIAQVPVMSKWLCPHIGTLPCLFLKLISQGAADPSKQRSGGEGLVLCSRQGLTERRVRTVSVWVCILGQVMPPGLCWAASPLIPLQMDQTLSVSSDGGSCKHSLSVPTQCLPWAGGQPPASCLGTAPWLISLST